MIRSRLRYWLALACLAAGTPAPAAVLVRPGGGRPRQPGIESATSGRGRQTRSRPHANREVHVGQPRDRGRRCERPRHAEGGREDGDRRATRRGIGARAGRGARAEAADARSRSSTQIIPILTKAGCNSGGCHGKAEGQNGFKLSVFGFDPAADYEALVKEGRGRRLFAAAPEQQPAAAQGDRPRAARRRAEDRRRTASATSGCVRWIAEGAPLRAPRPPPVVAHRGRAGRSRCWRCDGTQQLRVTAIDADGARRCVTAEAEYESNADDHRRRRPPRAGAGRRRSRARRRSWCATWATWPSAASRCRGRASRSPGPPEANFIDKHVWDKLERLGIPPSELADDATFLRRVYLDTIGTLPTADGSRAFLAEHGRRTSGRS